MVSESMLANVIAFEEAGVPLKELKQAVGRDGNAVVGRDVVFQSPIQVRLSEDDARQLIKRYGKLVGDYNASWLNAKRLDRIKEQNNVRTKADMISKNPHGRYRRI